MAGGREPVDSPSRLAAGIVAFGPSPERFLTLLDSLGDPVERVYVFVNGLIDPGLRAEIERTRRWVEFIACDVNLGVGAALNLLALAAILARFDLLLLFDQDSQPGPGLAQALLDARARCLAAGERPAVIAPRLVAPSGAAEGYKPPRYFARPGRRSVEGLEAVEFLATSGSLVDLDAFREVGAFRADYFIDAIDLEWCFRAWSLGFSCWVAPPVIMEHPIGEGVIEARALGLRTPRQKLFRMGTYIRNTLYGFRLPHIPLRWKLRQAAYLPVQMLAVLARSRFEAETLACLTGAVRDGLAGRLGPPEGAQLTQSGGSNPPRPGSDGASNRDRAGA